VYIYYCSITVAVAEIIVTTTTIITTVTIASAITAFTGEKYFKYKKNVPQLYKLKVIPGIDKILLQEIFVLN
jgi:hypothetical protein